jgi:hypothetical protein
VEAIGDAGGGVDELGWVAGGVADAAEISSEHLRALFELLRAPSKQLVVALTSSVGSLVEWQMLPSSV